MFVRDALFRTGKSICDGKVCHSAEVGGHVVRSNPSSQTQFQFHITNVNMLGAFSCTPA